jgi:hypothetical protein
MGHEEDSEEDFGGNSEDAFLLQLYGLFVVAVVAVVAAIHHLGGRNSRWRTGAAILGCVIAWHMFFVVMAPRRWRYRIVMAT